MMNILTAADDSPTNRGPPGRLIALLSIVVLAVMPIVGYLTWSGYKAAIHNAETMTRNYAAILEARLDATLRRADADLWELARTIPVAALSQQAVPRYARELNADLDFRLFNFKEIAGFRVADSDGDTLYTSASASTPRVNVSDRDYFRQLRDNPKAGLVFSEVVTGRSTKRQVLAMARALTDGRGNFIGIVYALLELEHFQTLFKSLTIGPQGAIGLYRSDDQRLVLRWPHLANAVNMPLNPQHPITKRMAAGDRIATLQFAAQVDGVQRIFSYQALESYPFFVSIGVSRDDELAEWRTRSLTIGASSLLLLGFLAWLLFRLWRAVAREPMVMAELKESEQALRDSAEKLRLFADNVPAITVSWDENLRCRFANKVFTEFFGLALEDILGKHVREVLGEEVFREIEGHFVQGLQGRPVTYQRTHKLPNGESRYLEVKLLPQIGDQGKVLGCFTVTTDITEHKLAEERIQRVAHHDNLTGLPNRLLFNDRLNQAISLAKRGSRQFALLYLDLDKFKPVNDTLGHAVGDELLQDVAARIRHQIRESDTVARVGGDEFTVILPDIARREDAETVAKKIIAALDAPFQLGSQKQSVDIGTSIGIALYPADAQDADALVKAADAAMYSAKQAGNSFRFSAA
jgi:diguanylate cyclase (GGDEF)-like protein/PAS domain S-box-containing protein